MISHKFPITWTSIFRQNIRFLCMYLYLVLFSMSFLFFFFEELSQFSLIWDHKFWLILRKLFRELEQRWIFLYNIECLLKILLLIFKSVELYMYFKYVFFFFKTVWSLQSETTEGSLFSCWCFGFQSKKGSSCMVRQTSAIRIFGPLWWKRRSEYDDLLKFYIGQKKKNFCIFSLLKFIFIPD